MTNPTLTCVLPSDPRLPAIPSPTLSLAAVARDVRIALMENHAEFKKLGLKIISAGRQAGQLELTYFAMRQISPLL